MEAGFSVSKLVFCEGPALALPDVNELIGDFRHGLGANELRPLCLMISHCKLPFKNDRCAASGENDLSVKRSFDLSMYFF